MLEPLQYPLGLASGVLIGFMLALFGAGGSIFATPLILYVVGVADAHVAIGTSACAVAANALAGLASHARKQTVKWRCGFLYATAGVAGALIGSTIGKAVDGRHLLIAFGLLMIAVGAVMLRGRHDPGVEGAQCTRENLPRLLGFALGSGSLAGFFGIGGGFLIVPGLIAATRMPMINAIGTSLVAVSALGATTAANYAWSGQVLWSLVGLIVGGGMIGALIGLRVARRAAHSASLKPGFALLVTGVGLYVVMRSILDMP